MPKSVETEDGSESNRLKICITNNNNKLCYSSHRIDPMKRTVRPLFSLLLLIFFAATFISRTFFHRSLLITSMELQNPIPIQPETPKPPIFNETLLSLASVDSSEAKAKQEIAQLLDGDMESLGRYRAFNTWRRLSHREIRARNSPISNNRASSLLRSPNFYRNWLGFRRVLREWWRNKRYQPEIMSELVRLVKNPIDNNNSNSNRYSSCAVVGNSGILLNSDFGDFIDSHEAVIRLNNARITGYEKRVGSKTTISFVNSNILHICARRESCFCHPYGDNVPIVMYVCQALHFLDYTFCNNSHRSPLIVTDPRLDVLCSRIVKYYSLKLFQSRGKVLEDWGKEHDGAFFHYSSGMQAVVLALGVCEKVNVFGFGKSDSAKHHYHTNQKAELRLHDYEAEYEFYRDLAERPESVPFVPRSFKIPPVTVYR